MYNNSRANGARHICSRSPERVVIFIDFHNLLAAMRDLGGTLDIIRLRDYLGGGRQVLETFLYIGIRPTHIEIDQNFHRQLRQQNFLVRTKLARFRDDGSLKCDFDGQMSVDVVDFVRNTHPDIVVLGSGDGDFSFIAQRLRLRGVRVEVAATRQTVSGGLLEAAHGFIDLGAVLSEISPQPVALNYINGKEA